MGVVFAIALSGLLAGCDNTLSTLTKDDPGGPDALNPAFPYLVLDTFQPASVVIGQPDFLQNLANNGGPVSAQSLNGPIGQATSTASGTFLTIDTTNNRVLGFNSIPSTNFAAADFVLGQASFTTSSAGVSASNLSGPFGVTAAGNTLAVADTTNKRVLLWTPIPSTNGAPANVVVGQNGFVAPTAACDQFTISSSQGLIITGSKLLVADSTSNRVLIWNGIPTSNYQPASLVLGQPNFTTCTAGASATQLSNPTAVWSDEHRVMVADFNNNRVLIWNSFPTTNGQAADVVVGQTSFTTSTIATSQTGAHNPSVVLSNGIEMAVVDFSNNRVLFFYQIPTTNGAPADVVLGQPDFNSGTANAGGTTSAAGFNQPSGAYIVGRQIVISDRSNHRALIFNGQ